MLIERSRTSKQPTDSNNALTFSCRALAFIVPGPVILRKIIEDTVDRHCDQPFTRGWVSSDIGGYVTGIATENQPLAAKYFEARTHHRLESNPMDARNLLLAWSISAYGEIADQPDLDDFWGTQQKRYPDVFADYIELQAENIPWVAAERAVERNLSLKELAEKFGMEAFASRSHHFPATGLHCGHLRDGPVASRCNGERRTD